MAHWENTGKSDEWYTPKYVFEALGCRFDVDVCSPTDISKIFTPATEFITVNSLTKTWNGYVWMNPPFGGRNGLVPWLNKIHDHGNGIALTPDRSSAPWWQQAASECDALLMVANKIKFIKPDGSTGGSPATGTTLFAYGHKAVEAIKNAHNKGLGISFIKAV